MRFPNFFFLIRLVLCGWLCKFKIAVNNRQSLESEAYAFNKSLFS
jgi:hypothetical protein